MIEIQGRGTALLQFFAIELIPFTFAVDFIPFAIEFVSYTFKFVALAL